MWRLLTCLCCFSEFNDTLFGRWVSGYNAGGQVSHSSTFYTNPQAVFDIPEGGREGIRSTVFISVGPSVGSSVCQSVSGSIRHSGWWIHYLNGLWAHQSVGSSVGQPLGTLCRFISRSIGSTDGPSVVRLYVSLFLCLDTYNKTQFVMTLWDL